MSAAPRRGRAAVLLGPRLALGLALGALSLAGPPGCQPAATVPPQPTGRDYAAQPVVLELEAPGALYALSDVHGAYDRLVALLLRHQLLAASPATPESAAWAGGDATLVVAGDMVDKGPASLHVLDLLRALQDSAPRQGGRVVVTLGNHEAEFLADPQNDKATADAGLSTELRARGVDPAAVARGDDPRGRWLRGLPLAARVGRWLFSHAGDTAGQGLPQLSAALQGALEQRGYGAADMAAAPAPGPRSPSRRAASCSSRSASAPWTCGPSATTARRWTRCASPGPSCPRRGGDFPRRRGDFCRGANCPLPSAERAV